MTRLLATESPRHNHTSVCVGSSVAVSTEPKIMPGSAMLMTSFESMRSNSSFMKRSLFAA